MREDQKRNRMTILWKSKRLKSVQRMAVNHPTELSSRPERTRISCYAALDKAACAPFRKEGRMKFDNATKIHRKSGVAQWRDLRFLFRFSHRLFARTYPKRVVNVRSPGSCPGFFVPFLCCRYCERE
jgi:hypothetical protein